MSEPKINITRASARTLEQGISAQYEDICSQYKLKPSDIEILYVLLQERECFTATFHQLLSLSQSFCSTRLSVLEAQGWIEKHEYHIGRSVGLRATTKTRAIRVEIEAAIRAGEAWAAAHIRQLFPLLNKEESA